MQFCHHCGNQLPDDAKVCDKCGNAVEVAPSKPAKAPKNNFGIVAFLIGLLGFIPAVLSFIFASYAIYYFVWFGISLVLGVMGIVHGVKHHQRKGLAIAGIILTVLDLSITIGCVYFLD